MAERSKAPDSSVNNLHCQPVYTRFLVSIGGVGSNPTSDKIFAFYFYFQSLSSIVISLRPIPRTSIGSSEKTMSARALRFIVRALTLTTTIMAKIEGRRGRVN